MVHKNRMKYEETKTIKIIPKKTQEWRFQSPKLKGKQQPTVQALQKILALYFHFHFRVRVRTRETISKTQMTQYHVLVISQIFPTCWWYIDADQLLPKRFCHLFSPMFRIKTNTKRVCVCVPDFHAMENFRNGAKVAAPLLLNGLDMNFYVLMQVLFVFKFI